MRRGGGAALVLIAALAAGCGGPRQIGGKREMQGDVRADAVTALIAASTSGDAVALEAMLASPLQFGGLWFPDPQCNRLFAVTGTIPASGIAAFARCLALVRLEKSEHGHPYTNVSVLTYAPGIELEVLFGTVAGKTLVKWIGYAGRRDDRDALPTISQRVLEETRVRGAAPVFDAAAVARIDAERASRGQSPRQKFSAWLKVCVNAAGGVTGVHPRSADTLIVADVFAAAAATWEFRPVVLGGQPSPVCSMMHVASPALPAGKLAPTMPIPVGASHADAVVLGPGMMGKRLAGITLVVPDAATKEQVRDRRTGGTDAIVTYCIDRTGAVDWAVLAWSSGLPAYDRQLTRAVSGWRFAPMLHDGAPVDACGQTLFHYTQR